MSEEMNKATGAEQTGTQEQGKEKLFTQEEVNGFIQSRLSQMKKQAGKESSAELDQRLKDIEAREMKLLIHEKLIERGMPVELKDVITCTSEEDLNEKLDRIKEIYGDSKNEEEKKTVTRGFQIGGDGSWDSHRQTHDPVREAFGLNR